MGQMLLKCDRGELQPNFCIYYKLTTVDRKIVLGILYTALLGIPIPLFFTICIRFVALKNFFQIDACLTVLIWGSLLTPSCYDGGNTVSF